MIGVMSSNVSDNMRVTYGWIRKPQALITAIKMIRSMKADRDCWQAEMGVFFDDLFD